MNVMDCGQPAKIRRELSSVFNLVWYAIQPLPFGNGRSDQGTSLDEGVFFATIRKRAGMQPERLGP